MNFERITRTASLLDLDMTPEQAQAKAQRAQDEGQRAADEAELAAHDAWEQHREAAHRAQLRRDEARREYGVMVEVLVRLRREAWPEFAASETYFRNRLMDTFADQDYDQGYDD